MKPVHIEVIHEGEHCIPCVYMAQVVAEVEDDGIGISEAVRDKIFEPFFSTKESSIDMGLGLAIIYGIVKDYGGTIDLKTCEGEGTTFKLSFAAT